MTSSKTSSAAMSNTGQPIPDELLEYWIDEPDGTETRVLDRSLLWHPQPSEAQLDLERFEFRRDAAVKRQRDAHMKQAFEDSRRRAQTCACCGALDSFARHGMTWRAEALGIEGQLCQACAQTLLGVLAELRDTELLDNGQTRRELVHDWAVQQLGIDESS